LPYLVSGLTVRQNPCFWTGTNYTWSITAGTLPDGISLNGATLSGTPTVAGLSTFEVEVQAGVGAPDTTQLSIEIFDPVLTVKAATLPEGPIATVKYPTTQLSAQGGDGTNFDWSEANGTSLPTGLTLSPEGVISGTVGTPGTYTFQIQVSSGEGTYAQTATAAYSLHFVYPTLEIVTSALPGGGTDAPYATTQLVAKGGDGQYEWSWTPKVGSYKIPLGLNLSTDGVISGYPEEPGLNRLIISVASGAAPFNIGAQRELFISIAYGDPKLVEDCYNDGYIPFRFATEAGCVRFVESGGTLDSRVGIFADLVIDPFPDPLQWQEDLLSSFTFSAIGGDDNPGSYYRWTSYDLPGWLSIASDQGAGTGTLSGTPKISGQYPFNITVISFLDSIPESAPVNIAVPWTQGGDVRDCRQGAWDVYGFNTQLQCERYVDTQMDSRLGEYPTLSIDAPVVPLGVKGSLYSLTFTAQGGADDLDSYYGWSFSGNLPEGLSLDPGTGTLSGTPLAKGTYSSNITVTSHADLQTASLPVIITVDWGNPTLTSDCTNQGYSEYGFLSETQCVRFVNGGGDARAGEYPALVITTESIPSAQPNVLFEFTVEASGGSDDPGASLTWSAGAGFPTDGLAFDTQAGTMSGTPTVEADYSFTITVTSDPLGSSASKLFTFSVNSGSTWLDPTTADQCKKGGWESFHFTNQGLCVQFVETGIDSRIGEPTPNKNKGGE